jgi:hypothetical protein
MCSFVCCVSFDRCVILGDVCYLCVLIVVPLPPGENPFSVKIKIISNIPPELHTLMTSLF